MIGPNDTAVDRAYEGQPPSCDYCDKDATYHRKDEWLCDTCMAIAKREEAVPDVCGICGDGPCQCDDWEADAER